jgi:hypothetical protein
MAAQASALPSVAEENEENSSSSLRHAGEAASLVLEALHASSQVLPTLKSALDGTLWLLNATKVIEKENGRSAAYNYSRI